MSNLTMQYCEVGNGGDSCMYLTRANNALIERCSFHDAGARNAATYHPNIIYCGRISDSTFRYNRLYNIAVEGLFFGDPGNTNIAIYGNLFYQGSIARDTGRAIQFDDASTGNTGILVYNNTIAGLPLGVRLGGPAIFSGSAFQNNIVYGCSLAITSGWTSDYNLYSGTTSEPRSIGSGSNPFLNLLGYDYHLISNVGSTYPRNKGLALGSPYNVDMDGVTRGWDGAWDMGAYEYGSTAPIPDPTPTPAPTPNPTPTATPTPRGLDWQQS